MTIIVIGGADTPHGVIKVGANGVTKAIAIGGIMSGGVTGRGEHVNGDMRRGVENTTAASGIDTMGIVRLKHSCADIIGQFDGSEMGLR